MLWKTDPCGALLYVHVLGLHFSAYLEPFILLYTFLAWHIERKIISCHTFWKETSFANHALYDADVINFKITWWNFSTNECLGKIPRIPGLDMQRNVLPLVPSTSCKPPVHGYLILPASTDTETGNTRAWNGDESKKRKMRITKEEILTNLLSRD